MNVLNRIRAWIDAKDHRPLVAAVAVVELPVLAAVWGVCIGVGAPWFTMPIVIASALLLVGWVMLVMAALTRWFP